LNRDLVKKMLYGLLILFAWLSASALYNISAQQIVSLLIFLVCVVMLYISQKTGIKVLLIVLLSCIGIAFYFKYLFYAVPVLLLISAHKEEETRSLLLNREKHNKKAKKEQDSSIVIYITFAIMVLVAELVYCIFKYERINVDLEFTFRRITEDFILIVVFILFLFAVSVIGCKENKIKKFSGLIMIYALSLTGVAATLFLFLVTEEVDNKSSRLAFAYWFVFVIASAINMENSFSVLTQSAGNYYKQRKLK